MIYAVRGLIKAPGFALVGIVSLGIGMGVTTSVYTTVRTMMFRPLPAAVNPQELVVAAEPGFLSLHRAVSRTEIVVCRSRRISEWRAV